MLLLFTCAAFVCTYLGGLFALRFKDKLHLILGFSAGAVIAVAFFDLLPEAIELAEGVYDVDIIAALAGLGFVIYLILDRMVFFHSHSHEDHGNARGKVGAGSLSLHSFLDGIAIGLAFQVSSAVGIIVAIAVLVHDFSDGINTVSLILKNNGTKKDALRWLFLDAIAPVLGVIATLFFTLPAASLAVVLAIFCGFFLYIGASDLLPESHHSHPTAWTTVATIIGMLVLYTAVQIAHI
jgi:ZIP family zinc transporter